MDQFITEASRNRASDVLTRLLAPTPVIVLAAAALFAVDQVAYGAVGSAVAPQAPLDWTNHLLTTMFLVWAMSPLIGRAQLPAALIASVVIDCDHIPGYLGSHILTGGTSRPYTHSLMTVAALLVLATVRPRWRWWASGAAFGVASHLWRDLAEPAHAGVALWWPVSDQTVQLPSAVYLISIAALAAVGLVRALWRSVAAQDPVAA